MPSYWELPPVPTDRAGEKAWLAWSKQCAEANRWEVLRDGVPADPGEALKRRTALRAIIAHGLKTDSLAAEGLYECASAFFRKAPDVPAQVIRAAKLLVEEATRPGAPHATTPDYLFLAAAFAWPLRDLEPGISDDAWTLLTHGLWQTDAAVLVELCRVADEKLVEDDDRTLLELVEARRRAGRVAAAVELLEAIVLVHADKERLQDLPEVLQLDKPRVQGAERAVRMLAEHYCEQGCRDRWAGVIVRAASALPGAERARAAASWVFDAPFDATYSWADEVQKAVPERPGANVPALSRARAEIARALAEGVHELARDRAEALLLARRSWARVKRPLGNKQALLPDLRKEIAKLSPVDIHNDPLLHCVAADLALIYTRTDFVAPNVQVFVTAVAQNPFLAGPDQPLHELQRPLQQWAARHDPYHRLRSTSAALGEERGRLSDVEKEWAEQVQTYFESLASGSAEAAYRAIGAVNLCGADSGGAAAQQHVVAEVCRSALTTAVETAFAPAGDLDALLAEGKALRAGPGLASTMEARLADAGRPTPVEAAFQSVAVMTRSLLQGPKGAAVDLGAALMVSAWAVARIGALLGRDVRDPAHLGFLVDAFAAACAESGEGAVAYESNLRKRAGNGGWAPVNLFGVDYAAGKLAGYLWSPLRGGREPVGELITHAARLLGFSLVEAGRAQVLPRPLRVLLTLSGAEDLRERVVRAAIHIGKRDHLLELVAA